MQQTTIYSYILIYFYKKVNKNYLLFSKNKIQRNEQFGQKKITFIL